MSRTTEAPVPATRTRELVTVVFGTMAGLSLGVLARLWMRLIATEPEFSWSGTIFIVLGFTIFGLAQSLAALARRRRWRPWAARAARSGGIVGMLPLFVGAGGLMMPTVVGGGLAAWRVEWPKPVRATGAMIASVPVVVVGRLIVGDFGWSFRSLAGIAAMLSIYGGIVWASRATLAQPQRGWRLRRVVLFGAIGLAVLLVAQFGIRAI